TLVTGLHPDRHGIVYNTMTDPDLPGRAFRLSDRGEVMDRVWWDDATPIWVSAEAAGITTATLFWPGSEAATQGGRPPNWLPCEQSLSSIGRFNMVLNWMRLPPAERPGFVTLYFDIVDTMGHWHGPASPELEDALAQVDAAL